jgi:nucleoside-diphosphate-sugar epimerase
LQHANAERQRAWLLAIVCSDRPVPIPVPGVQLVTLTHVEDVASMLAHVPGSKAAIQQHYNVCSDRAITFVGEWCWGCAAP